MKKGLYFLLFSFFSLASSATTLQAENISIDTNKNHKIITNITNDQKTDNAPDWKKMENMTSDEREKYLEEQKKVSTTSISETTKEE